MRRPARRSGLLWDVHDHRPRRRRHRATRSTMPTRIVPMIVGVMLIVLLMQRRVGRWHLEALGFAFLVAYAPIGVTYLESPTDFFVWPAEISLPELQNTRRSCSVPGPLPRDLPALLAEQIRRTLELFVKQGYLSGYYPSGPPAFDVVTGCWSGSGSGRHSASSAATTRRRCCSGSRSACVWQRGDGRRPERAPIPIITPAVFLLGDHGAVWRSRRPSRPTTAPLPRPRSRLAARGERGDLLLQYTPRVERAERLHGPRDARAGRRPLHFPDSPH